jgi:hypothetical protein
MNEECGGNLPLFQLTVNLLAPGDLLFYFPRGRVCLFRVQTLSLFVPFCSGLPQHRLNDVQRLSFPGMSEDHHRKALRLHERERDLFPLFDPGTFLSSFDLGSKGRRENFIQEKIV